MTLPTHCDDTNITIFTSLIYRYIYDIIMTSQH